MPSMDDKTALIMLLKDYRSQFIERLTPLYDTMEAESIFYIVLEELKGWKRVDLAMNANAVMDNAQMDMWNNILIQLEQQKPVQYVFGKAHFYGLEFFVDKNTLIPRSETEELVEWIIKENRTKGKINILDIGTGSGCIAVSLAKNLPLADVYALDVSEDALAVAKKNAEYNNVKVIFLHDDILKTQSLNHTFDVIVSNPPYVRHLEKTEINKNVLEYEPHLALFVEDNDPLLFYRKIAMLAKSSLKQNGKLYFEINQYLGNETAEMLEELQYKQVTLKKDIYGNDRMIACSL